MACLAADGLLRPGEIWRQESVIGSTFDATYRWDSNAASGRIIPTIVGRAFVCGQGELLIDDADPLGFGFGLDAAGRPILNSGAAGTQ